jgi:hypothetical protein
MKKLLLAAVAASALSASPALAADATYTVTGTVTAVCSVTTGTTLAFGSDINSGGLNLTATTTNEVDDTAAYCNGSGTTLTVSKVDMTNQTVAGAAPSGFTKTISFTPVVTIGGTGHGVVTGQSVGAFQGLKVKATNPSTGSDKALAGSYSGSITVTLAPAA